LWVWGWCNDDPTPSNLQVLQCGPGCAWSSTTVHVAAPGNRGWEWDPDRSTLPLGRALWPCLSSGWCGVVPWSHEVPQVHNDHFAAPECSGNQTPRAHRKGQRTKDSGLVTTGVMQPWDHGQQQPQNCDSLGHRTHSLAANHGSDDTQGGGSHRTPRRRGETAVGSVSMRHLSPLGCQGGLCSHLCDFMGDRTSPKLPAAVAPGLSFPLCSSPQGRFPTLVVQQPLQAMSVRTSPCREGKLRLEVATAAPGALWVWDPSSLRGPSGHLGSGPGHSGRLCATLHHVVKGTEHPTGHLGVIHIAGMWETLPTPFLSGTESLCDTGWTQRGTGWLNS
jgi:hypothetical protein